MASEVVGDNMHMDTRVFKVADFKSEVMTSEVLLRPPWPWRLPWPGRPFEALCIWIPG